jgi:hypothetical protein
MRIAEGSQLTHFLEAAAEDSSKKRRPNQQGELGPGGDSYGFRKREGTSSS